MANFLRKSLSFFLILVLINFDIIETEARPLNIMKTGDSAASRVIEDFLDGLSLGAIKQSGPSPGVGHGQTLGGIKDSGPSPGEGHKAVTGTHQ
ncbi:hypothetical protein P3X46_012542 [Hevea brasiliensis]|uniref:Transmembrane protein n=1 Tax=Hevea brasiliensis TaxID=3981 RepID=A0ABQ9MEE3_HEVBR|nr:PAMP-induced secreted peptide 2 [Hevea brasiliensis]KAJ9177308.1 hypothetical protein P3X46_012542 [Hevea brasiliensis]